MTVPYSPIALALAMTVAGGVIYGGSKWALSFLVSDPIDATALSLIAAICSLMALIIAAIDRKNSDR